MESEIEKLLTMRKAIFDRVHLLGVKKMLSKRKEKDGSNTYQKTLDKVAEAEKELMNPNKE